jgi:hypothetical protein
MSIFFTFFIKKTLHENASRSDPRRLNELPAGVRLPAALHSFRFLL